CSFEKNDVSDVAAGFILSAAAVGLPECSTSNSGCVPSSGIVIAGNRMRRFDGRGDPRSANVFLGVEANAGTFTATANLYCAPAVTNARFLWQGQLVDFATWTAASGTDGGSTVVASSDPRCAW